MPMSLSWFLTLLPSNQGQTPQDEGSQLWMSLLLERVEGHFLLQKSLVPRNSVEPSQNKPWEPQFTFLNRQGQNKTKNKVSQSSSWLRTCHIAEDDDFEPPTLLPPSPQYWDHRNLPPCLSLFTIRVWIQGFVNVMQVLYKQSYTSSPRVHILDK